MHLIRKGEWSMGLSTNYLIGGLINPAVHYEIGGSIFFGKNITETNYHLKSVHLHGNALELNFTPDSALPAVLRAAAPNYLRLYPHESIDVRVKTTLFEGDRTIEFVYLYDCVMKDGALCFRQRKLSRILPQLSSSHISRFDEYDKLIKDGYGLVAEKTQPFAELDLWRPTFSFHRPRMPVIRGSFSIKML